MSEYGGRVFDARLSKDPRNANYPMRALLTDVAAAPLVTKSWYLPEHLDQDGVGACVSFDCCHDLLARPARVANVTNDVAFRWYHIMQTIDEWEGEDYEGTSLNAGAKALRNAGFIDSFYWAQSVNDILQYLCYKGGVCVAMDWTSDMMDTDSKGFIKPTGDVVGGHAIYAQGYRKSVDAVKFHQSWGAGWGSMNGNCLLKVSDLKRWWDQGRVEAAVFVGRHTTGRLP